MFAVANPLESRGVVAPSGRDEDEGVDRRGDPCVARNGAVEHPPSKRSATYGELAGDAAAQDVPKVKLKDPSAFTVIGKSLDRLDARPKVDGSGIYGIDIALPGMLTAVIPRTDFVAAMTTWANAGAPCP